MLKRQILSGLVMLAVAAGLVVAAESPAMAAYSDCPSNNFCIFGSANGNGNHYNWNTANIGPCVNIGGSWNDVASSIYNRYTGSWKVSVYKDANCLGGIISDYSTFQGYVGPGQSMNMTGLHNDAASSWRATSL